MAESFSTRLKHAWNAFTARDDLTEDSSPMNEPYYSAGALSYGRDPSRRRSVNVGSERSIISSIYTRIAVDVALTTFEHVRTDEEGRYLETINSGLNNCLNVEANQDQTALAFKLDAVYSLLDEGHMALVPIDTTSNPNTGAFDIATMRVGKVVTWHPYCVEVEVWNEAVMRRERVTLSKSAVAIVENPFYSIMNESNSTLKRLVRNLALLDDANAKANSSKLDLIVQLPYAVKTPTQERRAEDRKKSIETQLTGSKYGIAYIDSSEKVTQLNRSIENTLPEQIKNLTSMLYGQLGLDETILNGTANSETLNNYYVRVVSPIIEAMKQAMIRTFLSKTARTQRQSIMTFQDPFRYLTVNQIAQIADILSRNEILTGNELRGALGFKPSSDPSADELRNKNLIDMDQNGEPIADDQYADEGYDPNVDDYSTEENQNGSY